MSEEKGPAPGSAAQLGREWEITLNVTHDALYQVQLALVSLEAAVEALSDARVDNVPETDEPMNALYGALWDLQARIPHVAAALRGARRRRAQVLGLPEPEPAELLRGGAEL